MTRPSSVESDGIIDQLAVLMQHRETLPIMGSKASMHCGVPRRGYPPDSCAGDDSDAPRGRRQDWQIAGSDRGAKGKPTALQPASREAFVCGNETLRTAPTIATCVPEIRGIRRIHACASNWIVTRQALPLPGSFTRTSGYRAVTPDAIAARVHRGTTHIDVVQRAHHRSKACRW